MHALVIRCPGFQLFVLGLTAVDIEHAELLLQVGFVQHVSKCWVCADMQPEMEMPCPALLCPALFKYKDA